LFNSMELTFHLPDEAEDIIRVEADGHVAPVRLVGLHDKGMDIVMHGVVVEILYDADDMISDNFELVIVIVKDQVERVFHT